MPKNKGGREIRKPKQPNKPKTNTEQRPTALKIFDVLGDVGPARPVSPV